MSRRAESGPGSPQRIRNAVLVTACATLVLSLALSPAPQTPYAAGLDATHQGLAEARAELAAVGEGTVVAPLVLPAPAPGQEASQSVQVVYEPPRRPVDFLVAARAMPPRAREPCPEPGRARAGLYLFPINPRPGDSVRVVAVSSNQAKLGRLRVTLDGKPLVAQNPQHFRAPPYVLEARVAPPREGSLLIELSGSQPHRTSACLSVKVSSFTTPDPLTASHPEIWPVTAQWDHFSERLFGAWVARLFFVEPGGHGGWRPLHQLTRDSSRNWLHNALGMGEDDPSSPYTVVLTPDCGDLPYFLRAYFAWKLGLPFSFQRCTRGNAMTGPICPVSRNNLTTRYAQTSHPVRRFNRFTREWIGWGVHSGTTRTLAEDNEADFYPVDLRLDSLRPGRIFVDPAGHVFVLSQQIPGTERQLGLLFGVDAHPDFSISRKRFSPGTFVFDARVPTGGFKAFRPLVYENERIRRLTNAEIQAHPHKGDFSLAQSKIGDTSEIYAIVQKALNPFPVDPVALMKSKIHALHEVTEERVEAVQLGVDYMRRTAWRPIQIPWGSAIFETDGPWEIYSTPARDLRLLMVMEDVLSFPREVIRNRSLYRTNPAWSDAKLLKKLQDTHRRLTHSLKVTYRRSDDSPQTLSIAKVISRRQQLHMGYHPNDCPELRWGAAEGSAEMKTCTRRALPAQREQMSRYQVWFQLLRRPNLRG